MHDIRYIRENPAAFDAAMVRRGVGEMSSSLLALDEARRAKIVAAETALADRNAASKQVGAAKASGDEAEFERLRALVADKKAEIAALEEEAKAEDAKLKEALASLPNLDQARAMLLGVLQAPMSQFARTLAEPPAMLARVLGARGEADASA